MAKGSASRPENILVAVDGSTYSENAAMQAINIAEDKKARITFLSVVILPVAEFSGDGYVPFDQIEKDARREVNKFLNKLVEEARSRSIEARTEIITTMSSVVDAIVNYAEQQTFDLIVTGTRGLGGFKRLLLGSVAGGIVHYAHCSVLVVR